MTDENKKKGLPDIAEMSNPLNVTIIVLGLLVFLSIFVASKFFHNEKKVIKPIEENYTIQQEVKAPVLDIQPKQETITASQPESETISPEVLKQQIALMQQKQLALQQRLAAPLMVVNNNTRQSSNANAIVQNKPSSQDTNTKFMQQVSSQTAESVTATSIGSLDTVIAEGRLIHAILEPAINSDLPGYIRASVSEPVYSEDGSQVLILPGSRLIGQYKSDLLQGQSRIFAVWTRLIRPDGISVQLGSPSVDSIGMSGMEADEVNRHFWERFGTASLLSLIGTGASNIGVNASDQNNSASQYREALAQSFSQSANQSLQQQGQIATTLKKYQGQPVIVFVAKDLHFDEAIKQVKPKINVF